MCITLKREYKSWDEAKKSIKWLKKTNKIHTPANPYKCNLCHNYHVGTSVKQPKKDGSR